jgi:arylsulfatase A
MNAPSSFIAWLLLLSCLACQENTPSTAPVPSRPNFIVILCDDLGYGDVGAFASTVIQTPRLDALAQQGLKLTSCYSGAPVCSPARAALMTGRNPYRSGIGEWIPEDSGIYLDTTETTLPKLLQQAGYATGLIGKWHLNSRVDGTEPGPRDHGFDFAFYTQNNAHPTHRSPDNFIRQGTAVGRLAGNSTTLTVDTALAWIGRQEQPFAAFVTLHAPHEPIATPPHWQARYDQFDDTTQRVYYGSVSLIDHSVGRLLDSLAAHGLAENTLLFFTSDNGPETLNRYPNAKRSHGSPGPLRGMKLHITEAGYRVPGILYWPGHTQAGMVSDEPLAAYDVLPTFAALAGAQLPDGLRLDGANFLPVLEGKPIARNQPLYWQYNYALSQPWQVALRDGPWKLVADTTLTQFALYDLSTDLSESQDQSAAHPAVTARLQAEMLRLYEEINR